MSYRRKILEGKKISRNRKKLLELEDYVAVKRQCLRKMAYPTEKGVLLKINRIADEGRNRLRYYQCPYCNLYHISHKALAGQKFVS